MSNNSGGSTPLERSLNEQNKNPENKNGITKKKDEDTFRFLGLSRNKTVIIRPSELLTEEELKEAKEAPVESLSSKPTTARVVAKQPNQASQTTRLPKNLNVVSGETIKCLHCNAGFGKTLFKDGTRLRCDCGFMHVIKVNNSVPSAYEILGVESEHSVGAARNAWNRIQKKYPFHTAPVAYWQARKAFYKVRENVARNPMIFEVSGHKGCLACPALANLDFFCCVICGKVLQTRVTEYKREVIRQKLRNKLIELADWDELFEEMQEYIRAEELILKEEYNLAASILQQLQNKIEGKTTTKGNHFELLQYLTVALLRTRKALEEFSAQDVEALHRILMIEPKNQDILLLAGIFALAEMEMLEASRYLDYLMELGCEDENALRLVGLARLLSKQYQKALEPLLQTEGDSTNLLLARTYAPLKKNEEARKYFQLLLDKGEDPVPIYHYGCFLGNIREYQEAFKCFRICENFWKQDFRTTLMLGQSLSLLKAFNDAEKQFERTASYGGEEEALMGKGQLAYLKGDIPASIACFKKVLEKNPHHLRALLCYGNLLEKQNQLKEALEQYTLALSKEDPQGFGLVNMGLLLLKLEQRQKARRYLAEAFKLGTRNASCLSALGMMYTELKDFMSAKMVWEILYEIDPRQEVGDNLGKICYFLAKFGVRRGDYLKAIQNLEDSNKYTKIENQEELLPEVVFRLGLLELLNEDLDLTRLKKIFKFTIEQKPERLHFQYFFGLVLFLRGEFQDALDCFTKVLRLKPDDPLVLRQICLTKIHLNDPQASQNLKKLPKTSIRPSQLRISYWLEISLYIKEKDWIRAATNLAQFIRNSNLYELSAKTLLQIRILFVRVRNQMDENSLEEKDLSHLEGLFVDKDAELMEALYLILTREKDESYRLLKKLYESNSSSEILEVYRFWFAVEITQCRLRGEDPSELLSKAKEDLSNDIEVLNWECDLDLEIKSLNVPLVKSLQNKSYLLLEEASKDSEETLYNYLTSKKFEVKAPYSGFVSEEQFAPLKKEKIKVGTESGCEIIIPGVVLVPYELMFQSETGKFTLYAPEGNAEFLYNERPVRRANLNHRDVIKVNEKEFLFLEHRDPSLIYKNTAVDLKLSDQWRTLIFEKPPLWTNENYYATLRFVNVGVKELPFPKQDFSRLDFLFE